MFLWLLKGAGSFVKKSVFGVSNSLSKVTGSIGKGQLDVHVGNHV